jgi:prepilin peptidase CpaA
VKLFAAVGAFAGPGASANLALCVLLAGGVLGLARLALFAGGEQVLRNLLTLFRAMRWGGHSPSFDAPTQTAWRMPYAAAIAAGVLGYGVWTLSGHPPILNF